MKEYDFDGSFAQAKVTMKDGSTKMVDVKSTWDISVVLDRFVVDKKSAVELAKGWPSKGCRESEAYTLIAWRCCAQIALFEFCMRQDSPPVVITSRPKRGVFVNEAVDVGELMIVPGTSRLACVKDDEEMKVDGAIECSGDGPDGHTIWLSPAPTTEFVEPFWAVRIVEKKFANVKIEYYVPDVKLHVSSLAGSQVKIHIPVYTNTKKLKRGDEILVHRERKAKQQKRAATVEVSAASEAPRTKQRAS